MRSLSRQWDSGLPTALSQLAILEYQSSGSKIKGSTINPTKPGPAKRAGIAAYETLGRIDRAAGKICAAAGHAIERSHVLSPNWWSDGLDPQLHSRNRCFASEGRALSSSSGISASEVATTAEPPFPRTPVDAWGSRPSHFPFEVRHGGPSAPPATPQAPQNTEAGVCPRLC